MSAVRAMRAVRPWVAVLCLVLEAAGAPNITHFSPHAVVPGQRTKLTFSGSNLQSASNLWTSFSGSAKRVAATNEEQISFEVDCPVTASGVHALQLAGPEGISNLQWVLADTLRVRQNKDTSRLEPPVAVDAAAKTEKTDRYTFQAAAGENYSIEVIAHRIGSEMDPVIRVLKMGGREIAFCDDEPGVWRDARFVFRAPTAGEYTVVVHDVGFGGGTNFDYRLRLTREPLVFYSFPLVDPAATTVSIEPSGLVPASPANPLPVVELSNIATTVEKEPNDSAEQAQLLTFPVVLHGRFQKTADVDLFKLQARKDQKLTFQSQSRSVGSPCDLLLSVRTQDGKLVRESDSASASDAALTNQFSESGEYLLQVTELSGASLENIPYRIKLMEAESGVIATTENTRLEATPGGSAALKVSLSRFDYIGPVQLQLEPEIEGLTLENAVIPEKKNEVELKIKAAERIAPGFFAHFRVKASTGGKSQVVSTRPALRKSFPLMLHPHGVVDGLISFGVKSP